MLGVAYKQDIDDYRESPAIRVIEELEKVGADIVYFDPYISKFKDGKIIMEGEKELTKKLLESSDIVIITTAHTNIDYKFVVDNAKIVFDTKNVTKEINKKDNVYVL